MCFLKTCFKEKKNPRSVCSAANPQRSKSLSEVVSEISALPEEELPE